MPAPSIQAEGKERYRIEGELQMGTVPRLWQRTERLFAEMPSEVWFDLRGVSRSDSAGLALLLEWMRAAQRAGVTLHFENLPTQIRDIARLSELLEVLPLSD